MDPKQQVFEALGWERKPGNELKWATWGDVLRRIRELVDREKEGDDERGRRIWEVAFAAEALRRNSAGLPLGESVEQIVVIADRVLAAYLASR